GRVRDRREKWPPPSVREPVWAWTTATASGRRGVMDDRFGRLSLSPTGGRGLLLGAAFFWVAAWAVLFTATSSGAVPPGRGLEQVSPPNKNGGDAVIGGSQGLSGESFSYASEGPGRVVYNSFGAFAGAPSGY